MNDAEKAVAVRCALGRMFSILMRPYRDGDDDEFSRCRSVVFDCSDAPPPDRRPDWARDRLKGAAGQ